MSDDVAALRASKFGQLTVGSVMEKEVQSGMKDSEAKLLASYMMEGFGSVPIIDETSKLVGIVSEFDLLKALRKGKNLEEVVAGDIMTPNPVSVTQDTNVLTLIDVLQNNHLIRVPVVDSKGKLIGIVARRDLLRGYLQASGS
ncbi:MAG: CBS domain-containing protein [Nitrospirales bacterium]|nr:CBS domain-containing protein [Nitrospira sp.]MDR4460764.1 CBS domain-containing protein [Nitrospirales bacterium]MDR4461855.1 CBS domain-containing protein [Nitrospirales bacterium]